MGNYEQFIRERKRFSESFGIQMTFTFTMDAFPDYTKFNKTEKVLASIQVISDAAGEELTRESTKSNHVADNNGFIVEA